MTLGRRLAANQKALHIIEIRKMAGISKYYRTKLFKGVSLDSSNKQQFDLLLFIKTIIFSTNSTGMMKTLYGFTWILALTPTLVHCDTFPLVMPNVRPKLPKKESYLCTGINTDPTKELYITGNKAE